MENLMIIRRGIEGARKAFSSRYLGNNRQSSFLLYRDPVKSRPGVSRAGAVWRKTDARFRDRALGRRPDLPKINRKFEKRQVSSMILDNANMAIHHWFIVQGRIGESTASPITLSGQQIMKSNTASL